LSFKRIAFLNFVISLRLPFPFFLDIRPISARVIVSSLLRCFYLHYVSHYCRLEYRAGFSLWGNCACEFNNQRGGRSAKSAFNRWKNAGFIKDAMRARGW
jgi:hypothetical protein